MKKLIGTGLIADFPTLKGNIWPKALLEKLIFSSETKDAIQLGLLGGGILDYSLATLFPESLAKPKDNIITHFVTDIGFYKDEVVVEVETVDSPQARALFDAVKDPRAALVCMMPESQIGSGLIIKKVDGIRCVHIGEREHLNV